MTKLPFKVDLTNKVAVVTGRAGVLCGQFVDALAPRKKAPDPMAMHPCSLVENK